MICKKQNSKALQTTTINSPSSVFVVLGKKAVLAVIPIILSIVAIIFTYQSTLLSQKQIELGNEQVAQASIDVLNACNDLHYQIQNITVNSGPSDQLNQFIQASSDSIKSCKTSLQSIQDSCKGQPSMQACKDPRLIELTDDFARINP